MFIGRYRDEGEGGMQLKKVHACGGSVRLTKSVHVSVY